VPIITLDDFDARLSRKRIKNINLRIDRHGHVSVSAPMRCPMNSIVQFLQHKRDWILKHQARLRRQPAPLTAPMPPLADEAIAQMQRMVPPLLEKWQAIIGVEVYQWRIRTMKSRWGSCNPSQKRISLNAHLMHYPLICLEYVLVHELVHLLEASHNQRFYVLMTRFMPEWKDHRAQLKFR